MGVCIELYRGNLENFKIELAIEYPIIKKNLKVLTNIMHNFVEWENDGESFFIMHNEHYEPYCEDWNMCKAINEIFGIDDSYSFISSKKLLTECVKHGDPEEVIYNILRTHIINK